MNFLWKREEREREGVGVSCGEGKGLVSKIPNWEGKEKGGPTPSPRHHEFVKPPSPSVCTHTHTSAEEALHSQWVESWSSNCAETSLPFRFSLCLCLHLGCWDKPNVDPDVTWLEVLNWFQKNLKVPTNIFFFSQGEPTLAWHVADTKLYILLGLLPLYTPVTIKTLRSLWMFPRSALFLQVVLSTGLILIGTDTLPVLTVLSLHTNGSKGQSKA